MQAMNNDEQICNELIIKRMEGSHRDFAKNQGPGSNGWKLAPGPSLIELQCRVSWLVRFDNIGWVRLGYGNWMSYTR